MTHRWCVANFPLCRPECGILQYRKLYRPFCSVTRKELSSPKNWVARISCLRRAPPFPPRRSAAHSDAGPNERVATRLNSNFCAAAAARKAQSTADGPS